MIRVLSRVFGQFSQIQSVRYLSVDHLVTVGETAVSKGIKHKAGKLLPVVVTQPGDVLVPPGKTLVGDKCHDMRYRHILLPEVACHQFTVRPGNLHLALSLVKHITLTPLPILRGVSTTSIFPLRSTRRSDLFHTGVITRFLPCDCSRVIFPAFAWRSCKSRDNASTFVSKNSLASSTVNSSLPKEEGRLISSSQHTTKITTLHRSKYLIMFFII